MKRILSIVIAIVTLLSTFAISSSAAGSIIFQDDFSMGFKPLNWVQGTACEFKWDSAGQCLVGYGAARVLQPNYTARDPKIWDQFYGKYDVQVRDFDDIEPTDNVHSFGIWVRDQFESENQGAVYIFYVEIDNKNEDGTPTTQSRVCVRKEHTFQYRDENNILQDGSINHEIAEAWIDKKIEVGEDAPWYEIGTRVTEGRLQFYLDQELIFDLTPNPDDEMLGHVAVNSIDATIGTQRTPLLLFASKSGADLYCAVDNFEIWTPDYDFVAAPAVTYGDVNGDAKINLGDASLLLKKIAKWDVTLDETAADVNCDGKINLGDASLLLKKIAKWDVELGPQK